MCGGFRDKFSEGSLLLPSLGVPLYFLFGSLTLFCAYPEDDPERSIPLSFFFPYTLSNRMKQYLTSFPSFPTLHSPENEGRVEGQVHPQQNAKENTGPGSAEAARAAEFSVAEGKCNGLKEPESIQKTTWQSGTRGPRERG